MAHSVYINYMNKVLVMLYYLGGDNIYQSSARLEELKKEFLKESGGAISSFNADEAEKAGGILKSADSLSLFSQSRLIIVRYLSEAPKNFEEKVVDYLASNKNAMFVFWEPKPLDKRKKLYKHIKKHGVVEEFAPLPNTQLKSWINKYLQNKVRFDPESIETLILKVGNDQLQLSSILDNLILLIKAENKERLTTEDIDKFVAKTVEESIWELVDAISTNNKKVALNILESLLQEKKDFMIVIAMIARQFRILVLTKNLLEKGHNQSDIIRILRLHPFVARKAVIQSANFSIEQLKKMYQKLVNTDLAIKEGRFEEKLALNLFIAAL